jgi:hypothetical protein
MDFNYTLKSSKVCCRCKQEFPLTTEFFHVAKFLSDGFNSHCKTCRKKSYYLRRSPIQDLKKALTQRFNDLKTRTKKKRVKYDIELDFDIDYLMDLWKKQDGKCAISGISMTYILYNGHTNTNVSIDRKDSFKGYSKDNIQLTCVIINKMKLDLTMDDLTYYCKQILKNNGL